MSSVDNTRIAQRTVGMLVDNAEAYVERFGLRYRTVHIDGVGQMQTNDARTDRVNFYVVKGRVTKAHLG